MKKNSVYDLFLAVLSGLILSLGWTQLGIGWITLIGFVPLLILMERLLESKKKHKGAIFLGLTYITFLLWNTISTWWIYYATLPGAIAAIMLSSLLMTGVMYLSFSSFNFFGRRIGYFVFITNWVAFEYIFMNSQISWPWLILGNSFANNISLIQWYEFVGHLGGSVWILVVNILTYETYRQIIIKQNRKKIKNFTIGLLCLVFVPVTFSLIRFYTYEEKGQDINIVVIQPNIDPNLDKFNGLSPEEQLDLILDIANKNADKNIDYFVCPETALTNGIWEDEINDDYYIRKIRSFLRQYPDSKFIIGAVTNNFYKNGIGKSETAQQYRKTGHYYDLYNTSLQIDTSQNLYLYHKSKLVPGVEMMPYPKLFGFLQDFMLDLGGITGSHGTQPNRTVFPNKKENINIGVPICYESVYGEFISEFVNEGANILFIITNDGWWEDTPGYRQHRSFSKIRAVETRKSIARSANTGISCFINQRGEVIKELGWWQRGAIRETIKANDNITFYTRYGDFLARMSLVISIMILAIQIVMSILKRTKNKN